MGAKKPQSPRPDQLWPEGVPHPTSPATGPITKANR